MTTDARPFLPEPDPDPVAQKKPHAKRTLLLWALLIMMFLGIWQFLSPSEDAEHRARRAVPVEVAPCRESGPSWSSVATTGGPILFLSVMVFLFFRMYGAVKGFNRLQEPGLVAQAERRFPQAVEAFERVVVASSKKPAYSALAQVHLGLAHLEGGQLDAALASFAKAEKTLGLPRASGTRLRAAQELTLVHALKGDLDTAEKWAEDARKRLSATYDSRVFFASRLCLAEAVLSMRRGKAAEAVEAFDKSWLVLRGSLDGNGMRVAEVLRAFAEVGGGVRQYNVVQERRMRVEPIAGNEFAFLGVGWREMRSFLEAHRLVKEG